MSSPGDVPQYNATKSIFIRIFLLQSKISYTFVRFVVPRNQKVKKHQSPLILVSTLGQT